MSARKADLTDFSGESDLSLSPERTSGAHAIRSTQRWLRRRETEGWNDVYRRLFYLRVPVYATTQWGTVNTKHGFKTPGKKREESE